MALSSETILRVPWQNWLVDPNKGKNISITIPAPIIGYWQLLKATLIVSTNPFYLALDGDAIAASTVQSTSSALAAAIYEGKLILSQTTHTLTVQFTGSQPTSYQASMEAVLQIIGAGS